MSAYHTAVYRVSVCRGRELFWYVGNAGELLQHVAAPPMSDEFVKFSRDFLAVHSPASMSHAVKKESAFEEELYLESSDSSSRVSKRKNTSRRGYKRNREDAEWDGILLCLFCHLSLSNEMITSNDD